MFQSSKLLMLNAVLLLATKVTTESIEFDEGLDDHYCTICSCTQDATVVDCSRRGLVDIPDGMGDEVTKLNISNNEISRFPTKLHSLTNLISLDLSANLMNTLPVDALQNLTSLEVLDLSKNSFSNWRSLNPNELLRPAVKLRILNLSHNQLATLANLESQDLFISPSLETLILEDCDIKSIHGRSPLGGLTAIRILKLSHNPIRRIQSLISPTLKSLDVSNCQLTYIHFNELLYLPSLIHLQLSHNNRLVLTSVTNTLMSDSLRYLDISYCNLMQPSLGGFPNLKKVVLSHNMIRFLNSREFINNTKLEYLDLSNNNIGSLKSDTFSALNLVKYLDLSWNEIATIPETTLLKMPSLNQINLSRNYLTQVGHLRSMSLTILDMSSCDIEHIGKDSLEGLQSLVDINLSRNLLSSLPDSLSSSTLRNLNLNFNRLSIVSNSTFYMLPRLTSLSVVGNRFTNIWTRLYFKDNPYLESIDLDDNMWRCDCSNEMYDFYEFLALEPNMKEDVYNLRCHSPRNVIDMTWLEACYFTWYPNEKPSTLEGLTWFLLTMIVGLSLCFVIVTCIRRSLKKRLATIQAERERRVEEARDRIRNLRLSAEQQAQCNTPDPRDLISPPSYDEALTMPKLNASTHSLNETGTGKSRRKRGRRKTKSSGDLLDETERNGDIPVVDDMEMVETDTNEQRPRRRGRFGSHEITELEHSPGSRRRRMSAYEAVPIADPDDSDGITVIQVEADVERPLRVRGQRSPNGEAVRESDF